MLGEKQLLKNGVHCVGGLGVWNTKCTPEGKGLPWKAKDSSRLSHLYNLDWYFESSET